MEEKDIIEKELEKKQKEEKKDKKVSLKEYQDLQEQYTKAMATAAHHQNLSKYYQAEYDKMMKYRSQNLIEDLLPTLDSFELAFKAEAKTEEAKNYKAGFEFVYRMFLETLKNDGLEVISPTVGQEFNSDTMQIVETVETENKDDENKITVILLNGYKLKDRLIRPSSVKVYTLKKEEPNKEVKNTTEDIKN